MQGWLSEVKVRRCDEVRMLELFIALICFDSDDLDDFFRSFRKNLSQPCEFFPCFDSTLAKAVDRAYEAHIDQELKSKLRYQSELISRCSSKRRIQGVSKLFSCN